MDTFLKFLLDIIWRLAIIALPVLGYVIEKNNDTSLIFGIEITPVPEWVN
jgi:hypothetical protein